MRNKPRPCFWAITKSKEAEKYGLQILDIGGETILSVDMDKIPDNMNFDEFVHYLLKAGIVTNEKALINMKTIYHRNSAWWGDSTIIIIEGGKGIAKVSHDTRLPSNKAYISDIMVLESSRGKGLGNLLLFLAEEECKKMGAKYAVLDVEKDSFAADWYTKKGYRTFGEDTNLYYMEKAL